MDLKLLVFVFVLGGAMIDASSGDDSYSNPFSPDFMKDFDPFGNRVSRPRFPSFPNFGFQPLKFPKIEFPDFSKIKPGPNTHFQGASVSTFTHGGNVDGETSYDGGSTVTIVKDGKVEKWVNGVKVE